MKVDGGCHCGALRYEADIEPERVIICHCTDCQIMSGSAYRTVAFTRPDGFRLLSGAIKTYVKTADSGKRRAMGFCPDCGTHLYATNVGEGPKVYGLRVGTANQRDKLVPKAQCWCDSALDWSQSIRAIEKVS